MVIDNLRLDFHEVVVKPWVSVFHLQLFQHVPCGLEFYEIGAVFIKGVCVDKSFVGCVPRQVLDDGIVE